MGPVDHRLVARDGFFEAENPNVRVRAGGRLEDGFSLPDSGVGLVPVAAAGSSPAPAVVDGRLSWIDVAADTDLWLEAIPGGLRSFEVLRSERSPERLEFDLRLPAGARLVEAGGGVEVFDRDGRGLAVIAAPWARDAGGEPVEVSLSLAGQRVVLAVSHREKDVEYPLLVDPAAVDFQYWYGANDTNGPFRTWSYWSSYPAGFGGGAGSGYIDGHSYARGLFVWNRGAKWYGAGQVGQWGYGSWRESFIYRMDLAGIHHRPDRTCLYRGLYDARQGAWQTSYYSGPYYASSPVWWCGFEGGGSETHCAAAGCAPAAPTGNVAVWGLMAYPYDGWRGDFTGYVGAATIYLSDYNNPTLTPVVAPPAGWTRGGDLVWYYGTDPGLGMKRIRLTSPGNPSWSGAVDYDTACTFSSTNRCGDTAHAYTYLNGLPEGIQTLRTEAWDIIDRTSGPRDSTVKIDRSAPEIALSGSLWDSREVPLTDESYELDVAIIDGSSASSASQQSGVRDFEVRVDGEVVYKADQSTDNGGCPANYTLGSCPLSDTWLFTPDDYPPGEHTVTVIASDQLGQSSQVRFDVNATGPDPQEDGVDDVQEDVDVDAVVAGSEASFGSRYGGAYIDDSTPTSVLRVLVVDPTPADAGTLQQVSGSSLRVVLTPANHSASVLDSVKDAVAQILQTAHVPSLVAVDDPTGTVSVLSGPLDATLKALLIPLGPLGVVQLDESPEFELSLSASSRSGYPPYEAGMVARVGASRCTSGFTVASSGNYYGTTAGHCGRTTARVSIGGRYISNIGINGFSKVSDADVARFFIPNSAATGRVFTARNTGRDVQGYFSNRALRSKTALCFQGAVSGNNNCGKIGVVNGSSTFPTGETVLHQWCIFRRNVLGDSGGPVYGVRGDDSAKAAGIVSSTGRSKGGRALTCFTSMPYVLDTLNARLVNG